MSLTLKSDYYFTTQVPAILGAGYRATLMAVLDYESAMLHQGDLADIHAQVLPNLATGTSTKVSDLTYYLVKSTSGEKRVIAKEWLLREPQLISDKTVVFTVNGIDAQIQNLIAELLRANGIYNFTMS